MTETDVVDFLINLDDEFKQTYLVYQDLLYSLKNKNYDLLYKTLLGFLPFIKNTFNNNYHNNFIKVIKRITFDFRSFRRLKARIMICKGLVKFTRKKADAFALAS